MKERSQLIEFIRSEICGPSQASASAHIIDFDAHSCFHDQIPNRVGPLFWRPEGNGEPIQEVLYFDQETPHRKYGVGLLHPECAAGTASESDAALQASDTVGVETEENSDVDDEDDDDFADTEDIENGGTVGDDFEVTSPDVRRPSSVGISCCVSLDTDDACLVISLPREKLFAWQHNEQATPTLLNGRYERCTRRWSDEKHGPVSSPMWRRRFAVEHGTSVVFTRTQLQAGRICKQLVEMPDGSPIQLRVDLLPRPLKGAANTWLITVVLRNVSASHQPKESVLYQTYFEVSVRGGSLTKYPESQRPFNQLDKDEQSLALLYRESSTWGTGHGCAAGWNTDGQHVPEVVYADVLPAVELPSMTPDVEINGVPLSLSMKDLASLPEDQTEGVWRTLEDLANGYSTWIQGRRQEIDALPDHLKSIATFHLDACEKCSARIRKGIQLLREHKPIRCAFELANLSMLLQQIGSKQLHRRPLQYEAEVESILPKGHHRSPWDVFQSGETSPGLGRWRAFQIAFLLMSLDGVCADESKDRDIVDLIWFPTGGGKTEAYLGVMAIYMFHERLLIPSDESGSPRRDGTNVLMRYTLRMLTTQQFQRAASLICAMEFLREKGGLHKLAHIPGKSFSLGLWIGGQASPNKIKEAQERVREFRNDERVRGNPLVLTECPWCRSEIGRYEGARPAKIKERVWKTKWVRGVSQDSDNCPRLKCPDSDCHYGAETTFLPVEVIDARIYKNPPSLVIATADKLAMIAYRPEAGALFGRERFGNNPHQIAKPPGLIVQDELHLISGPLGTLYGLYEAVFERLCSFKKGNALVKPKLIASTATIRGASEQVKALYARLETQLFPSPGLSMSDSFFGRHAKFPDGKAKPGRLYVGIHAADFSSVQTTQVRTFAASLFEPWTLQPQARDPWWTLLAFYNSIRELSGARTLFDSDIRSRLKFIFNREGYPLGGRRKIKIIEELTSRLSQSQIVRMMDDLARPYGDAQADAYDACLASNIIEVGVDIDRLSLMSVVGQPKTTSTYIQVTGRVGRRWDTRPGLILTIYNPSKSRDRSHFEQFHSYHRRLYERVEPTSATPFALSALQRALPGVAILYARQHSLADVSDAAAYENLLEEARGILLDRCEQVQIKQEASRSASHIDKLFEILADKWNLNPQEWESFPPSPNGEYLMLWPGQFKSPKQQSNGIEVPSSMRQVDGTSELSITQGY